MLDRLPEVGAGFVWERPRNGVETFPVLRASHPDASAIFTTRLGGVSGPPVDSLNLSFEAQAASGTEAYGRWRVEANRSLASRALGAQGPWATVKQVHGSEVVEASPDRRVEADGLWTSEGDTTLAVLSADCVLVFLAGPRGVCVAHAGWRGILAGVVEAAVGSVSADVAYLGPAIGPCCYEVGREVSRPFASRFSDEVVTSAGHVDLWAAATAAALDGGAATVHACRLCTACRPELFFSHRRDGGRTGRQSLLAVRHG